MADAISRNLVIDAGKKIRLSSPIISITTKSASTGQYVVVLNRKEIGDTMKRVSKVVFREK